MTNALVLAHGALGGPWCWQALTAQLETMEIRCVAVDLDRGSLEADRAALQDEVDRLARADCRVSAIGHSLGCLPTALLDPVTLRSVIFLAGPVPGAGMPDAAECVFPAVSKAFERQADGRLSLPREVARDSMYHRCTRAEADASLGRLRPTFVYGARPAPEPIWEAIPATYIECSDDRMARPSFQRAIAARMPFSESLDWDHSPMIGRPDALAKIVGLAMAKGR